MPQRDHRLEPSSSARAELHGPAVGAHQALDDRESEPEAVSCAVGRARSDRTLSQSRSRPSRGLRRQRVISTASPRRLGRDRDRRPGRGMVERVREEVVEHLLESAGRCQGDGAALQGLVEPYAALVRVAQTNAASRSRAMPVTSTGRGDAAARSARASASRASTRPDSRSTSASAPSSSPCPAGATSRSRFSSRSRSAASGVRSWCDASATNSSWERTSTSILATIVLNVSASRLHLGRPFDRCACGRDRRRRSRPPRARAGRGVGSPSGRARTRSRRRRPARPSAISASTDQ